MLTMLYSSSLIQQCALKTQGHTELQEPMEVQEHTDGGCQELSIHTSLLSQN